MKKALVIFILALISNASFGQTEKAAHRIAADNFVKNYNADNYQAIYFSFSSEMQNILPLNKTEEYVKGLKANCGRIIKREFVNYHQSFASYKTTLEKGVFTVDISVDEYSKVDGLLIQRFKDNNLPKLERNKTKLELPFKGEWTVFWGGDTKELNYHVVSEVQKNAFDFVIQDEKGKSYKTDAKTNEDYYAFGKDLFSPCAAEVVLVVDGVKDNKPGVLDPSNAFGNNVVLKTANDEYLIFAHFKQNSIKVKLGQKVTQGQLLGLCGNSGNSSEAHLHFHIQNVADMNIATGVKCYFDKLIVNGQMRNDYSPVRNDRIIKQ